jgi:hypothetical protein
MKRLLTLTSALALILTASISFAAEEANWGTIKQHMADGSAAKRTIQSTSILTATDESTTTTRSRTVSQWFAFEDDQGGIKVIEQNGKGLQDNLSVTFTVPEQGVAEPVEITMTVIGQTLSELVVAFEPGGLVFLQEAQLTIEIGMDLVDVDFAGLTVYHQYSDGTREETTLLNLQTKANGQVLQIQASVPGFSRYGLRSGW